MLNPKRGLIFPDCIWLYLEQPWVWDISEGAITLYKLCLCYFSQKSVPTTFLSTNLGWVRLPWTSLLSRQSHLFTHPYKALAVQISLRSLVLPSGQADMKRQVFANPLKGKAEHLLPSIHLLLTAAPGLAYSLGLCCGFIQPPLLPGLPPPRKRVSQVT